jgi:hypothetical protein
MEMDARVVAAVSAVIAIGILTVGIYKMTTSSSPTSSKKTKTSKPTKKSNTSSSSQKPLTDDENENNDLTFKGYKKTSTGKTTTYFHRELSVEEKRLLGDSTPKRIDSPAPISGGGSSPNPVGGSAWNAAGTYEEKNISEWSQTSLKKKLRDVNHRITNGQVRLSFTRPTSLIKPIYLLRSLSLVCQRLKESRQ